MINIAKRWIASFCLLFVVGGSMTTVLLPNVSYAADKDKEGCASSFLGFPAWYRYLTNDDCDVKSPKDSDGLSQFIWLIVLNCIDMALVAIIYVSGIYMLYGGFLFITSRGSPDNAAKARTTMLNAGVGLIISILSVALVSFIAENIKK